MTWEWWHVHLIEVKMGDCLMEEDNCWVER
jgi:hypothetical protein